MAEESKERLTTLGLLVLAAKLTQMQGKQEIKSWEFTTDNCDKLRIIGADGNETNAEVHKTSTGSIMLEHGFASWKPERHRMKALTNHIIFTKIMGKMQTAGIIESWTWNSAVSDNKISMTVKEGTIGIRLTETFGKVGFTADAWHPICGKDDWRVKILKKLVEVLKTELKTLAIVV